MRSKVEGSVWSAILFCFEYSHPDIPRSLSHLSSLESSCLCQHREHGHHAWVKGCASVASCRGYRRNRESHDSGLCHRACLSPDFCRAISCGLSSDRGGRNACRRGDHRSGRSRVFCTGRGRAGLVLDRWGCDSGKKGACGHAPLCCESDVWCRGRRGGRAHGGLRFCGMVSTPFSPPQMVVSLYRSDCSYFCLSGLAWPGMRLFSANSCRHCLRREVRSLVVCMLGKKLPLVWRAAAPMSQGQALVVCRKFRH